MNGSTLVIGAGTNLGGRRSILRAARDLVAHRFGVGAVRVAPVWQTPPMGPPQPDYLNTAFALPFDGDLGDALARCLGVERSLGRERRERWGPRTLDLDLLWHASKACATDALAVPHSGLRARTFALDPLLALAPGAVDPRDGAALVDVRAALGPTVAGSALGDAAAVQFDDHGFVAIADDRADLLAAAAESFSARHVDPSRLAAATCVAVEARWPVGLSDDERVARWLAAVRDHLGARGLALRRCAVVEDADAVTRGVLVGAPSAGDAVTGAPRAVVARRAARWEARVRVDA